jgi:beta-barrel assembly-enhancing protease
MKQRAGPWVHRRLAAAGLGCLFAVAYPVMPEAAEQSTDIDLLRLQASYDNGPLRVHDTALESHLAQIVKRLADANSEFGALAVSVHVLRESLPCAFVLDSGATYVSTGLIARLGNEAQLAGLIAAQVAAVERHDEQTLHRAMRDRFTAQFIPSVVVITATLGLGAVPLASSAERAEAAHRRELQAASDAVALGWVQRAGYDPRQVPAGLQRVLDALSREQRFGTTEISSADKLAARIESLTRELPTSDDGQSVTTSVTGWWRPAVRRYALDIANDDLSHGRSASLAALLDLVDASDGPSGQTAYLRAQDLQRREPGREHAAEVIAAYEQCIPYADAPPAAFRELAIVYRREGDNARARADFEQYLTRAPTAVDAPIIRGYLEGP